MKGYRLTAFIAYVFLIGEHMRLAFSHHFPFTLELTDQSSILVDSQHALAFFELTFQRIHQRFPKTGNGIEMRNDEFGRHQTESCARSCKTKTWDTFREDHRACRATCTHCATAPCFLHRCPCA